MPTINLGAPKEGSSIRDNVAMRQSLSSSPVSAGTQAPANTEPPKENTNDINPWTDSKKTVPEVKKEEIKQEINPEPKQEVRPEPKKGLLSEKLLSKKESEPKQETNKDQVKEEPLPEDGVKLHEGASEKSQEGFKALKDITKELRGKIKTYESELATFRQKATESALSTEEFQKIQKERDEYSQRLSVLDLKNHPSYKEKYELPKQQALSSAMELIKANGVENVDLESILDLPRSALGKAVADITDKLPRFDAAEVEASIRDAVKIRASEREALSKSSESLKSFQQQHATRLVSDFNSAYDELSAQLTEYSPEVEIPEGADESVKQWVNAYNESRAGLRKIAEQRNFGMSTEKQAAEAAIKSAGFDHYQKHVLPSMIRELETMYRERAALQEEINSLKRHNPNKGIQSTPIGAGGSKNLSEMSHAEAASHIFTRR